MLPTKDYTNRVAASNLATDKFKSTMTGYYISHINMPTQQATGKAAAAPSSPLCAHPQLDIAMPDALDLLPNCVAFPPIHTEWTVVDEGK